MILGIHCSVRAGFSAALAEAEALGCAAFQILPYRRHHPPTSDELAGFKAAARGRRVLVHSRFVPNLMSADPARRRRSAEHLASELRLAAALGGEAYVLHAGAYSPGSDIEEALGCFRESLTFALRAAGRAPPLLVENIPGGGRRVGGTLEELARLRDTAPVAGFCLDTAHAWAAGYDVASAEGMLKFLSKAHRLLGAESVKAFHLNDTRALLGSHRESHEHWGEGRLGAEGLRVLLRRPEYVGAIGIVETPKEPGADERNLAFAARQAA